MSLKSKLNRMKKHLNVDEHAAPPLVDCQIDASGIPYLKEWEAFSAKPFFFEGEYIFIREKVYSLDEKHGLYRLGALNHIVDLWKESKLDHPLSLNGHNSSDLFFFDTETTGLGRGTGNTIFLLGFARVFHDRVVIKQLFLPDPSAEVALYHYFLSEVDYNTLVTYNGKAFDWPQVKTRHTLIRDQVPKLPQFGHFDLLHASRRLWKSQFESLKLSIVEKEILNIHRESDTPGFMAPMIYFHYLEDHHPEGIFEIMKHNETDILSLISLYVHISNRILGSDPNSTVSEQYEVAKWLNSVGNRKAAMTNFEKISEALDEKGWASKASLAALCKKEQKLKKAVELWNGLVQEEKAPSITRIQSGIELAKYYEHKEKDIEKALHFTMKSIEIWQDEPDFVNQIDEKWELELKKRQQRLVRKVGNIK